MNKNETTFIKTNHMLWIPIILQGWQSMEYLSREGVNTPADKGLNWNIMCNKIISVPYVVNKYLYSAFLITAIKVTFIITTIYVWGYHWIRLKNISSEILFRTVASLSKLAFLFSIFSEVKYFSATYSDPNFSMSSTFTNLCFSTFPNEPSPKSYSTRCLFISRFVGQAKLAFLFVFLFQCGS